MYGTGEVSEPDVRRALVRVNLYAGGTPTGLINAQLYGIYRTGEPQPLTITYVWREGDRQQQHVERIPAGSGEHLFRVPTGDVVADEFVRMQAD